MTTAEASAVETEAATTETSAAAPTTEQTSTQEPATQTEAAAVEYKFDAVEGVDADFDTEITSVAKKLGWTQEQAAAYRAHEIEVAKAADAESTKTQAEADAKVEQDRAQKIAEWEKANREHKKYGGDKFNETTVKIDKLLAQFGAESGFAETLAQAPALKNEPTFHAFLAAIAHGIGEGGFVQANAPKVNMTDAELFYGKKQG